jgi:hypothetical protein
MDANRLVSALRRLGRQRAGDLAALLQASRPTLMRTVRAAGPEIVSGGRARRTAYAARRRLAGSNQALPVYRVDPAGHMQEVAAMHLTYPDGCRLEYLQPYGWPMDADMADGWFDGIAYPFQDMRPSGFLGRQFAGLHAALLQVDGDPTRWSDDDVLRALTLFGADTPGDFIIGRAAARLWLDGSQDQSAAIRDDGVETEYLRLAEQAMSLGWTGSSAAGEFPKFTAVLERGRQRQHVLVKFSGSDTSPGTVRWSDLLVCENLAATAVAEHLSLRASRSTVRRAGGRTFVEVERFDRQGRLGRSGVVSWLAVNAAFFGVSGKTWSDAGQMLLARGWLAPEDAEGLTRLWHFGQLIANNDMHDANLSFEPVVIEGQDAFRVAPVYDMLPMMYAPARGVELPERTFSPRLPLPDQEAAWLAAASAALSFWQTAARDERISKAFRSTCAKNAKALKARMD